MTETPAPPRRAILILFICMLIGVSHAGEQSVSHYDKPPAGPTLTLEALDSILSELDQPQVQALSMWDQLWTWVTQFFEDRAKGNLPLAWLNDFRLSAATGQWIFYITCALIVLLSIGIVVNEVRHARGRRRVSQRSGQTTAQIETATTFSVEQLGTAPLYEQPALLLQLILAHLSLQQPRPASLTHREIVRASHSLATSTGEPLQRIARIAERIRYAGSVPGPDEVEPVIVDGRTLLAELELAEREQTA